MSRKDTRRFRYRTDILVGNILRYFDTIRLQRFKGVLVYVNNVERGQPEIYVVLEEAQIGVRIRESYALDIDRLSMYQESMGMLDVQLSVPPQYGVVSYPGSSSNGRILTASGWRQDPGGRPTAVLQSAPNQWPHEAVPGPDERRPLPGLDHQRRQLRLLQTTDHRQLWVALK